MESGFWLLAGYSDVLTGQNDTVKIPTGFAVAVSLDVVADGVHYLPGLSGDIPNHR
ncbi:hypothetical protein D3C76_1100600 [compost metagenome]